MDAYTAVILGVSLGATIFSIISLLMLKEGGDL